MHPVYLDRGHRGLQRALLRLDMRKPTISIRYRIIVLTIGGKILTKEYQAKSYAEARKKADMAMDIDRILQVTVLD